jgi:hypothetical protein
MYQILRGTARIKRCGAKCCIGSRVRVVVCAVAVEPGAFQTIFPHCAVVEVRRELGWKLVVRFVIVAAVAQKNYSANGVIHGVVGSADNQAVRDRAILEASLSGG